MTVFEFVIGTIWILFIWIFVSLIIFIFVKSVKVIIEVVKMVKNIKKDSDKFAKGD